MKPVNRLLQLSPEEMRAFGYRIVDMLAEHISSLPRQSVGRTGSRTELESKLREPLPEEGMAAGELLDTLRDTVLESTLHTNHPRFFGFIPSPANYVSAMVEALAHGYNVFAGTWLAGSGALEVELITIDWLREICGMPERAGGLFVSGGSVANLTALAVAREKMLAGTAWSDAVIYYSDQTHSSMDRAVRLLGFDAGQIRKIPADADFRLPVDALRAAIAQDRTEGRLPFCVVANVGTTNTGAIDPLVGLAALCEQEDLWLHADGAYGAAAALSHEVRPLLEGMGAAHSLSLDPHKWLFQPFETGCVLVRDDSWLRETFAIHPEYMKDTIRAEEEANLCEYGIQLTRSARALKVWASLKMFGAEAFRQAIDHGLRMAEVAERELRARPEWRIVTPAQMAIVSFRYERAGASPDENDAINERAAKQLRRDGFALVTSTVLNGRTALRLCTINPRTTELDVKETISRLGGLAGNE